jgi:hypothetical protein
MTDSKQIPFGSSRPRCERRTAPRSEDRQPFAPISFDIEAGSPASSKRVGTKLSSASGPPARARLGHRRDGVARWCVRSRRVDGLARAADHHRDDATGLSNRGEISTDELARRPVAGPTSSDAREPGEPVAEAGQQARSGMPVCFAQPEGVTRLDAPTPPRPATTHPVAPSSTPPAPSLADEAAQINAPAGARRRSRQDARADAGCGTAVPAGRDDQERRGYAILALVA